ncbi:hypothetical protein [Pleionea mediterranea]|uniref:Uncharacterized protein n=1 Tax=Pleionea mediterranea TaxID=523701 RepID=A0A316FD40_9GAMM|nr:hypothetical protein [Pleionea mediterranea]PWK45376.1 hypothetical protein C8D97_11449 [Pleionea mediterranea]
MDYSNYKYNELLEALSSIDKELYPENYKKLKAAIDNYCPDRFRKEEFLKNIASISVEKLEEIYKNTDDSSVKALCKSYITKKKKNKIWRKYAIPWVLFSVSIVPRLDVEKYYSIILILAVSGICAALVMKEINRLTKNSNQ